MKSVTKNSRPTFSRYCSFYWCVFAFFSVTKTVKPTSSVRLHTCWSSHWCILKHKSALKALSNLLLFWRSRCRHRRRCISCPQGICSTIRYCDVQFKGWFTSNGLSARFLGGFGDEVCAFQSLLLWSKLIYNCFAKYTSISLIEEFMYEIVYLFPSKN